MGAITLAAVAILAIYYLVCRTVVGTKVWAGRRRLLLTLCLLSAGALACFVLGNLATIPQQRPFQDDESSVLSVSAAYVHGQELYPKLNAPVEYSILYGPATFLIYAVPVALHAENLMWFQAWVWAVLLVALTAAYFAFRFVANPTLALMALGYAVCVIGMKAENEWSNKGDAWLLVFVAAALWGAVKLRPGCNPELPHLALGHSTC